MSDGVRSFVCLSVLETLKGVLSGFDVARKVWEKTGIWGSGRTVREGTG